VRNGGIRVSPLEDVIRTHVILAIRACDGNLSEAAEQLKIDRRTIYRMVERYKLGDAVGQARHDKAAQLNGEKTT
jgi:transcriptional regulator of acetoin/glycerol metabolism